MFGFRCICTDKWVQGLLLFRVGRPSPISWVPYTVSVECGPKLDSYCKLKVVKSEFLKNFNVIV